MRSQSKFCFLYEGVCKSLGLIHTEQACRRTSRLGPRADVRLFAVAFSISPSKLGCKLRMNSELQSEAERFAEAVAIYLIPHRERLTGYRWPLRPSAVTAARSLGLHIDDTGGGLAATHSLRATVAARVRKIHATRIPNLCAELAPFCGFVVKTWGGLGANKDGTILQYVEHYTGSGLPDLDRITSLEQLADAAGCAFPLDGIASWSKWLNFVWPDWALIYDARMAFALNAIHYMQAANARALPVPPGRQVLLNLFDTQMLASLRYLAGRGAVLPKINASNEEYAAWLGNALAPPNDAYAYYLAVLRSVCERLEFSGQYALAETEMLLFYLSERDVVRDLVRSLHAHWSPVGAVRRA